MNWRVGSTAVCVSVLPDGSGIVEIVDRVSMRREERKRGAEPARATVGFLYLHITAIAGK
jgi:hypothetical protein